MIRLIKMHASNNPFTLPWSPSKLYIDVILNQGPFEHTTTIRLEVVVYN